MVDAHILSTILTAFDYDQDGVISAGDLQSLFATFNVDATSDDCDMFLENLMDFTRWRGDTSFRSGLTGLSIDGLERVLRASANTEVELRSEQWFLNLIKDGDDVASAESVYRLAQSLRLSLSEADAVDCIRENENFRRSPTSAARFDI